MARVINHPEVRLFLETYHGLALFYENVPIPARPQIQKSVSTQITLHNLYTHTRAQFFRNQIIVLEYEQDFQIVLRRLQAAIHKAHNTTPRIANVPIPIPRL
jgi:hypothetical protein